MIPYHPPRTRISANSIRSELSYISTHPFIDGVMQLSAGLVAVLNEHRQVLALNESFLRYLGVDDPQSALGMRPGEMVSCVHSRSTSDGCGTSTCCETCGAAIAMSTCQVTDGPVDNTCAISTQQNGMTEDLFFRIRACPLHLSDRRYLLVFLTDITREQRWASLERTFFHDLNNLISGITGRLDLMEIASGADMKSIRELKLLSRRLVNEINLQRALVMTGYPFSPELKPVQVSSILSELRLFFSHHPALNGRTLTISRTVSDTLLQTDLTLITRILSNMVLNALEATHPGGEVVMTPVSGEDAITFDVWNAAYIPPSVAGRIFQRNFSTKGGDGRGLGTYSMKLFGEKLLGGDLWFTSTPDDGTHFFLKIPVSPSTLLNKESPHVS